MKHASFVSVLSLALATACSTGITLTGGGERVQHVSPADVPVGCNLLGDVAIGIPPDAARPRTEEQLIILMRNKAAEIGGTHVIVDSKSREEGAGGEEYWRGRGVAYACPEETRPDPLEQTGGGEAPAEEPVEEEAPEDEGSAAEEDPIVDDLLSD